MNVPIRVAIAALLFCITGGCPMSAVASDRIEGTVVRPTHGRVAALSGIAFAIAYLIGTASLNAPLRGTDQKIVEFWSDSGNQTLAVISMYCFAIAGLVFLVFMSNLRAFLAARGTASTKLSEIVFGSGLVFVVMHVPRAGEGRGIDELRQRVPSVGLV